jgi:prepilin-type N-terminal cleavage/methylation domain-containing protein
MTRPGAGSRGGFTLMEVLIAVVILGTLGVALANSLAQGARRATAAGAIGYRTAALNTEVSRITALPAGTLANGTTTQTLTTQPFPYTVTTVAATSGTRQTVTITVTPTGPRAIPAVTRTIERLAGSGGGSSPFGP